ncbi:MAG: hypothetical protein ACFFD9_10370, partial [Candidatus Thorarchaeota archaeon]
VSGLADRNLKKALTLAIVWNAFMILGFSFSGGLLALIVFNIVWALPVVLWIGAERTLVVADVEEQDKGRALGTYQFMMTSTNLVAAPFGAFLWTTTGSLRSVWVFSGIAGLIAAVVLVVALRSMVAEKSREVD